MVKYFFLVSFCLSVLTSWTRPQQVEPETETYRLIEAAQAQKLLQPSQALEYIDSALVLSYALGNKRAEAYCYLTLGEIHYRLGRYPLSLQYLEEAQMLFEGSKEAEGQYDVLRALGQTYSGLQLWEKAKAAWSAFLEQAQQSNRWKDAAEAQNQLGHLAFVENDFALALTHYQKVLELNQSNNEPVKVLNAYNTLAKTCNVMGDTIMANLYSLQAGQFALENGFKTPTKAGGRETEDRQGDNQGAGSETREGSTDNNSGWEAAAALEANEGLALAYESQGLLDSALFRYKTARSLERNLYESEIALLEASLNKNQKLYEQLDRVNWRIENRQSQLRRQKYISSGLAIILLVLLASGFFILRSYRARQKANQQLALKSLRSQMNPHFIFNSLNSVNSFIAKNDARAANKYLADFSRLMRSVMENSEQEFIPLQTEIQILRLYLGLEHLRFQDRFDYTFTVDPQLEADGVMIPPMLIQPYIENAIWHGLRYKREKGLLEVHMHLFEGDLVVEISDNGIGRTRSAELKTPNQNLQRSTGLKNTAARLQLINSLYNQHLEISIDDLDSRQEDVGTKVWIKLKTSENTRA